MSDSYRGFGGVDVLSSGAGGSHGFDFEFGGWQRGIDLRVGQGGEDGYGHCQGLELVVIDGDALDSMYT